MDDLLIRCDVVLPYHAPTLQWLGATIDSVLNQQNAECVLHLVADAVDPSDDAAILRRFAGHPDIRFHRNEKPLGPYHSLHSIFDELETTYVAIQDSDDISLPHRIWHSVTSLERHGCELFTASVENFTDWQSAGDAEIARYLGEQGTIMRSGLKLNYCPSGRVINGTMVIRRDTFERLNGFNRWFAGCDIEFAERAHHAGVRIHVSDSVVSLRRLHATSFSRSRTHGHPSAYRQTINRERVRLLKEFSRPDFDPAAYGTLDARATTAILA